MIKQGVLEVEPVTAAVGAIARGVDLREPLDAGLVQEIRSAVLEHGVVFFRDQDLTKVQMTEFMSSFGTLCVDPFSVAADQLVPAQDTIIEMTTRSYAKSTAVWHSDSSLAAAPASFIALRAIEMPAVGGDTCWSSSYAAYDTLSEPIRNLLDGLTAVHSGYKVLPLMGGGPFPFLQEDMRNVHPVVRVNPETGRKGLFVNELWTEFIVELEPDESAHVLSMLYEHVKNPRFMVRWGWRVNDIALWDNRSFQHFAVNDYEGTRVLQKSLVAGDRPFGPS